MLTHDAAPIRKRRGARLPHWTLEGAAYFVTFRTFDSLPRPVVQRLKNEIEKCEAHMTRKLGRDLTVRELNAIRWKSAGLAEKYLDQGLGSCLLASPGVAGIVTEALHHFDGRRYDLHAWCVMPNHVHVLVKPYEGHEVSDLVLSWKTWSALHANRHLQRQGRFWQREYYDRILRGEPAFQGTVDYILSNPSKARLRDWEFVGARELSLQGIVWPSFSES